MKSGLKMLKKILSLFLLLFCAMPSFAFDIYKIEPVYNENIETQLQDVIQVIKEALPKGDYKSMNKAVVEGYKREKKEDPKEIKKYNDLFSAFAIQTNLALFELTQEKKYAKRAYKWSKIAVDDKTTQLYSIQTNILMASYKPNLKQMTKAYDLFREINLKEATDFMPDYQKLYQHSAKIKQEKLDAKKQKVRNALYYTLMALSAGCKSYGEGLQKQSQNYYNSINRTPTMYNATSRQIGDTTYTTIYGY